MGVTANSPARLVFCFLLILAIMPSITRPAAIIADHTSTGQFPLIPESVINQIKNNYRIFYGHTSHGSQILSGMEMVRAENGLYDYNNGSGTLSISENGTDLQTLGYTGWADTTRLYLNGHPEANMVMWSWCGGVSGNTEEGINIYLNTMNNLEQEYPNVEFVYMTGHLDGTGPTENLYVRNNQIRTYCAANDKILFDFADIESYDPDGNYYPDESDYCNWCIDWCATHTCPDCGGCAHSQCFNCHQKGKTFWWMMARVAGWIPSSEPICGDADNSGSLNVLDAGFMISYLYRGGLAPMYPLLADADKSGGINILDVARIISYLYKGGAAPDCPS